MKTNRLFFILCIMGGVLLSCGKENSPLFRLGAVADTIESYPSGGGVFIGYITDLNGIAGSVQLSVEADARLHPELTRTSLSGSDSVFELVIRPDENLEWGDYPIKVKAFTDEATESMDLTVSVVDNGTNSEDALFKFDQFWDWLNQENPEAAREVGSDFFLYKTYRILIVEHYTILTPNYEIRFCYHVMIPPYDWSKIRIRERNVIEAEVAAERSTDGAIQKIPVKDYPMIYGY
jgi:hypothetical protein